MPQDDKYLGILKKYWGYSEFRGIQREIIESIGAGKDTLGLMPTGGGKSITFQVPAIAQEGVCIVVTPLIALMKDQVSHLKQKGIQAAAIYSGQARSEIIKILENAIFGAVKLLYVSPERLASDIFLVKLKHMKVSFITVDEAHCISQWGYDFRPSYLQIAEIRHVKPDAPVLALTATATRRVMDDIMERLQFREKKVFRMSFKRDNLAYVVREALDKYAELLHILKSVEGSAIIYTRSRRRSKVVSEWLEQQGVSATFYHAGLEPAIKDERQKLWQTDKKRVMAATNAFGMGIDKPNVRLVIHLDCPDSVEAYFQEAGRAGRDGKKAYAILLWNGHDHAVLAKRIKTTFPSKEIVRDVYDHLAYFFQVGLGSGNGHTFTFNIDQFCYIYHFYPLYVNSALHILQSAGYIEYETDPDARARLKFLLGRDELYKLYETTPNEEAVISALLRNYSGLFSDYRYVEEALISQVSGLSQNEVYLILKSLSHRRILHFIPQRKTPFITYTQDRIDGCDVVIPASVYDQRKEQFIKHVNAIEAYATNNHVCRSRQLLRYFDETKSEDCGICDVCVDHQPNPNAEQEFKDAKQAILDLLADHKPHDIKETSELLLPRKAFKEALKYLCNEELVHIDGLMIYR